MALYNRRCIRAAGSTLFLSPFNAESPAVSPIIVGGQPVPVPFSNKHVTTYKRRQGWMISHSFQLFEDDTDSALAAMDALEDAFFDSDGNARLVDFCEWYDSAGTRKRIYRDCVIDSSSWDRARFEKFRRCDFTLISQDGGRYATFKDTTTPGVSPFEQYLVNPSGGSPAVPLIQKLPLTETFTGIAQITTSGQWQIVFAGKVSSTNFAIKGIKIIGCSDAGTGDTTLRVSNAAWDGSGSYIAATVGAGEFESALVTGNISPLASGSDIFVFITAAGGHADIKFQIDVESV